jgi:hypothetical protein
MNPDAGPDTAPDTAPDTTTDPRRAVGRDPWVRAAVWSLLVAYAAGSALFLLPGTGPSTAPRAGSAALTAVLLSPLVLFAAGGAGVLLRGWRWPMVPAAALLALVGAGVPQVRPINAVLVVLLVVAFVRVGRLRRDALRGVPAVKRVPGWSRDALVVAAGLSCLAASAVTAVYLAVELPQHVGAVTGRAAAFVGRVGPVAAACVALAPAFGVAVGAVGLLRGSRAWALGTAAQLVAYAGQALVFTLPRSGSMLLWVPINAVLLLLVVLAHRRLGARRPEPAVR